MCLIVSQTAGLQAAHHWNTVVDFRWHKSTHSPHWYEIPGSPHHTVPAAVHMSAAEDAACSAVAGIRGNVGDVAPRVKAVVASDDPDEL